MSVDSVRLTDVRKTFNGHEVIKGVSLEVKKGELVVFVGPSGCGKSTLLRLIAGLETPTSGQIDIAGRDVTYAHPSKRGVAMVFQSYALYPHMTVFDNIAFALKIQGLPKAEIEHKVNAAAETLQLTHLLKRRPKALSGGQRQRVAIGRAIVRQPDVFLFDEPLSNLDAALRGQMRVEIARLHTKLNATSVYVTHDQVEAMTLADKIVVLNAGRIEQVGSPLDLYRKPANLFVAGFIGSPRMNTIKARVREVSSDAVGLDLPQTILSVPRVGAQVAAGANVTFGVRPENLHLAATDEEAHLSGYVILIERLGGETFAYVTLKDSEGEPLIMKLDGEAALYNHQEVRLKIDLNRAHLFAEDGQAIGVSPDFADKTDESVHV
ncbi:MAG: sn-glycerol-3-phosphate ABC transporter ATP-binding protein UgpC [Asticcacaulis sp.]|uniref:ABC transporter ATP-binding protein n=1 Tax=Asticcacaulis sp. TaxID=1872648 RepID=UPI0025C04B35|nr:sn-glycerol-3-phosphate ABC transporter ATP-binding protein UgpC [Asticcacaulis sp.]MCA1936707.1 sn-glycerol-3-phosphate ABC transporter ATP-binding protein UgpC [Asticcacaulis sp.]